MNNTIVDVGGMNAKVKFIGGSIDGFSIDQMIVDVNGISIEETFKAIYEPAPDAEGLFDIRILGKQATKFSVANIDFSYNT